MYDEWAQYFQLDLAITFINNNHCILHVLKGVPMHDMYVNAKCILMWIHVQSIHMYNIINMYTLNMDPHHYVLVHFRIACNVHILT